MKAAIIGAGGMGGAHAEAYLAQGVDVVAVVDPAPAVADAFAQRFSVPAFTDLSALLESDLSPDAVSICTPPFAHRSNALLAIDAGLHVLCEKPLAHTQADARAIHEAASASRVVVATGYCHRFQPEMEYMQALVSEGRIGRLRTFSNEFAGQQDGIEDRWFGKKSLAGGGALLDAGIHSIDLFRFLCGEVEFAAGALAFELEDAALEVEHGAVVTLRSVNGVVGNILVSWKSPAGKNFVQVAGSAGSLKFDYSAPGQLEFVSESGESSVLEAPRGNRFKREIAAFVETIRVGGTPRTGTRDGLIGLRVVAEIYNDFTPRPVADFA